MINVVIKKSNILIKGHANFAELGKDIVCASVSSMVTLAINSIISIDENAIEYNQNDNSIEIIKLNDNESAGKILETLILMFVELAEDYPKNIKIRNEE